MKKTFIKMMALCLTLVLALGALSGCGSKGALNKNGAGTELEILETTYTVEDYAICVAKNNPDLLKKINVALAEMEEDGTKQAIVDKYISGVPHDLKFQQDVEGKPELHMATNAQLPPYEYYENDVIVGIDAEMAAAIADKLDMKLVIDDMDFDSIITAVQTGKADIGMAGMTVTEDRKKSIDFSDTYATGIQVVIVPKGSDIKSVDDLFANDKYLIGTQRGTTGDIYAEGDFGAERVMKYASGNEAVQALLTNKVDCVIIDNEPAKAYVKANNEKK